MNRLFIARHGNTFESGEPPRRIGAVSDLPLTAAGRDQASALGASLRSRGIDVAVALAGPLSRTRETATLVLAALPDPPALQYAEWLCEIEHGPDEGQLEGVVRDRIGIAALDRWDTAMMAPPGWIIDAPRRIAAWRNLLGDPPRGDTLLVTSNGAARFVFAALPSINPPASLKLSTGHYGVFAQDGRGWRLEGWNLTP